MDSRYRHHRSWNPYVHNSPLLLLANSTATKVFPAGLPLARLLWSRSVACMRPSSNPRLYATILPSSTSSKGNENVSCWSSFEWSQLAVVVAWFGEQPALRRGLVPLSLAARVTDRFIRRGSGLLQVQRLWHSEIHPVSNSWAQGCRVSISSHYHFTVKLLDVKKILRIVILGKKEEKAKILFKY